MGQDDRIDVLGDELTITMRGSGGAEDVTAASSVVSMLEEEEEREAAKARKTKRTPHEERRVSRRLNISFPTVEWKEAVLEQAERWDVRTSDFMTFCVAHTMKAIESGELRRAPRSSPTRFYHRAGENLNLPWTPEDSTEDSWS
jgi:hypothetical protein